MTARYRTGVRFRASVARSFGKRSGPALKGRSRAAQGGKAGAVAEAGPTPTYPIRFRYRAEVRLWFCKELAHRYSPVT